MGTRVIHCSHTDMYVKVRIYNDTGIRIKNNGNIPVNGIIAFVW